MFSIRPIVRQGLRFPKWTQIRSVTTLDGRPYIVSPCHSLSLSTYLRSFYEYVVCLPKRSSLWRKPCLIPPAIETDELQRTYRNYIQIATDTRILQREPGFLEHPARSYLEICARRPRQHLPGTDDDIHVWSQSELRRGPVDRSESAETAG